MNLPFATGYLPDFRVEKCGRRYAVIGTCFGREEGTIWRLKKDADRLAAQHNAQAREAVEGNAAFLRQRADRLATLRAIRAARVIKQGSLTL